MTSMTAFEVAAHGPEMQGTGTTRERKTWGQSLGTRSLTVGVPRTSLTGLVSPPDPWSVASSHGTKAPTSAASACPTT